jgi:hypothetical protein
MVQRVFPYGPVEHWQGLLAADYAAGIDTVIVSPQAKTAAAFGCMAESLLAQWTNAAHDALPTRSSDGAVGAPSSFRGDD